jgi:NO-binding membrane sensor protein with MHYT domain
MFRVLTCLTAEHDYRLVVLAGVVCFLASITAVNLFHRARSTRAGVRAAWLITAGAATGCGIWGTHFIAMLAYEPGVPTAYDIGLTLLSLVIAAAVTGLGLSVAVYSASRWNAVLGGGIVGGGIACMHYLGMWALEVPGRVTWWLDLVVVSIALGMVFGMGALAIALRRDDMRATVAAALLLWRSFRITSRPWARSSSFPIPCGRLQGIRSLPLRSRSRSRPPPLPFSD